MVKNTRQTLLICQLGCVFKVGLRYCTIYLSQGSLLNIHFVRHYICNELTSLTKVSKCIHYRALSLPALLWPSVNARYCGPLCLEIGIALQILVAGKFCFNVEF